MDKINKLINTIAEINLGIGALYLTYNDLIDEITNKEDKEIALDIIKMFEMNLDLLIDKVSEDIEQLSKESDSKFKESVLKDIESLGNVDLDRYRA